MAQLDDLIAAQAAMDANIQAISDGLTKLSSDQAKTLSDLEAAIKAGASPTDLTAVLAKAQAQNQMLTTIATAVSNIDTSATAADPAVAAAATAPASTTPPAAS